MELKEILDYAMRDGTILLYLKTSQPYLQLINYYLI